MANPLRLNPELIAAAERASLLQKRSIPKQIEFWASIGKAVENVIDYSDIFAILQGVKQIRIEPVETVVADVDDVFGALEKNRDSGRLKTQVTGAVIYYEASRSRPGMLDQVNPATGERRTGQFRNGKFLALVE